MQQVFPYMIPPVETAFIDIDDRSIELSSRSIQIIMDSQLYK